MTGIRADRLHADTVSNLQVFRLVIGKRIAPVDRIKPELFVIEGLHIHMDARPLAPSAHRHPASMRVGQGVNPRLPRPKPVTFAVGRPVKSALL